MLIKVKIKIVFLIIVGPNGHAGPDNVSVALQSCFVYFYPASVHTI